MHDLIVSMVSLIIICFNTLVWISGLGAANAGWVWYAWYWQEENPRWESTIPNERNVWSEKTEVQKTQQQREAQGKGKTAEVIMCLSNLYILYPAISHL